MCTSQPCSPVSQCFPGMVSPVKVLSSVFLTFPSNKQAHTFGNFGKNPTGSWATVDSKNVFMVLLRKQPCFPTTVFTRFFFPPRVAQLNGLQWLVMWSVPGWAHTPSTVLSSLKQTTLVWSVAELRCQGGSTCQSLRCIMPASRYGALN